jgi:hypothetical protein
VAEDNRSTRAWAQLSPLRGLRARRFATVRNGIDALRSELPSASAGEAVGPDTLAGIDEEVRHLLSLLADDGSALLKLWESSKAGPNDVSHVNARLSRLGRGLEARRAILIGNGDAAGRSDRSRPASAQAPQAPGAQSSGTGKAGSQDGGDPDNGGDSKGKAADGFSPSEAALLAQITEKFYASWQFKAIALALGLSAALAGTGTLLLAGKGLQLSEQLDGAYKRSADALELVSKAQTVSLTKQNDSLTREGDAFTKTVTDAKADIARQQAQFTETLQTETVNRVVDRLQKQLEDRTSNFVREIERTGSDAVASLPKRLGTATKNLATAETDLETAQARLAGLTPKLEPLGKKIDAAETQLAHISSAEPGSRRCAVSRRAAQKRGSRCGNGGKKQTARGRIPAGCDRCGEAGCGKTPD